MIGWSNCDKRPAHSRHKVNAADRDRPGNVEINAPADGSNRPNTAKKTHWELYVSCNSGQ